MSNNLKKIVAWGMVLGLSQSALGCAPPVKRAAKKTCQAAKKCDKASFDQAYDSIGDCLDDWKEGEELLVDFVGQSCTNALAKVSICQNKQYKKDCAVTSAELQDKCGNKVERAAEECAGQNLEDLLEYLYSSVDYNDYYN
jgi:hypothetical protein